VHVVFSIDGMGVGGTELNALRTAERLDRARFRVSVLCIRKDGPLASRYADLGIPVHDFPTRSIYGPHTMLQILRMARWLRTERAEIVHAHDLYTNLLVGTAARLAGTPVVIASRRWARPHLKFRMMSAIAFRLATRVLANSETIARAVRDEDRIDPARVIVIPNFVEESAFTAPPAETVGQWRRELGLTGDERVVGIIASLQALKDHASLIRAIASLAPRWPTLRLVIVGDGEMRAQLSSLVAELGVGDRVIFAGLRPRSPSFHYLFELSVLCSFTEGFPNSVVEAMAAGRPVVATRVGGIPDALVDGETGILVAPGSPSELAAALERLLKAPEEARAMGARGREQARERFLVSRVVPKLESTYETLLSGAKGAARV
jgi:glycosyltransferase involved in cell wall biosynthesis